MYRICLVDDEKGIAEGVKWLLEHSGLEVSVAGIAGDGEEGIGMIQRLEPDIVIVDVRMPVMDGLEMVRRLEESRETNRHTKFIMLSGYSEFEYARQAIRLGVQSYLCKPVEEEELYDVIQKVCLELDQEQSSLAQLKHLENVEEDYNRQCRDRILRNYLEEGFGGTEFENVLKEEGFPQSGARYICAILECWNTQARTPGYFDSMESLLRECLGTLVNAKILRLSGYRIALLLAVEGKETSADLADRLTEIREEIGRNQEDLISIGIGSFHDCAYELVRSFQEAEKALQNKVLRGIGAVICYEELEHPEETRVWIEEEEILKLERDIMGGDRRECRQTIHGIFMRLRAAQGMTMSQLQLQSLNMILAGIRTMPFMLIQLNDFFGKNILNIGRIVQFQSIEQLENCVVNTLFGIMELKQREKCSTDVMAQIKEYIREHFASGISLNEISRKFYLNPYYLSQLFKKKTGMTYQAYVTSLRMDRAKQALMEGHRVAEAAEIAGYSDKTWFSQLFEKTVGCKPSEYCSRQMEAHEALN